MPVLDVSGVQVSFPFTPYPCQVDYMSKVLTCLQKNQNGVLESPTGTGKTLSLLCASLAWQESRKAQVELNKQMGIASSLSSAGFDAANLNLDRLTSGLQSAAGACWGSEEFLVPRIIYASRTHSQLSQAVQELKRTSYNSVKSSVIGSREQLCIHQQVQKLTSNAAKVQMCRVKVSGRQCHFYNNVEEFKKKSDARKVMGNVVDIEDIVKTGHKTKESRKLAKDELYVILKIRHERLLSSVLNSAISEELLSLSSRPAGKTCPYYMARELKSDADIVFMPYNYLLDNKSRKAHGVELQGSVIIFDEAHNLEKICEESASFDLSSLELATAIEETTKLAEKVAEMSSTEMEFSQVEDSAIVPEFNLEDVIRLKKTLLDLEENLDKIEIPSHEQGKTIVGSFMFDFLSQVNINWSNKNALLDMLDKMATFLSNDDGSSILNTKGAGLSKFADCLKIVFSQEPRESLALSTHQRLLSQHFKVHIQKKEANGQYKKKMDSWSTTNPDKKERILSYWCFSPGHTMKDLLAHGVKVIILTSGTLSPLESFTMEMQIPFPVQLENPHVIEKSQVWLGTLCKGPDGAVLNSEYKNRSNADYQKSLGNTIVNFARVVPNGMLIFFPSYPVMERCIEKWKETNQWNVISQYKPVIVEPKGKTLFNEAMDEFYTKVNDTSLNGAIFMAVCRGKVSEGLDFADTNGRAVMITGLPYPPKFDPRVRLKMDFLRENRDKFKGLDANTWYRQQATRAVNQAIGRVIRHNRDFGAIVLCDTRFSSFESKNALPLWVRGQAQVYNNFGLAVRDVIRFFKEAEKNFPSAQPKSYQPRGGLDQGDGAIVSGACFEPSFTRRSQGRGHMTVEYERASDVACHIPSLRNSTDDETSVYKEYNKGKPAQKLGKKRSLLEALESVEEQSNNKVPETQTSTASSQFPSYQLPKNKLPGKQKKIKLKEPVPTEIIVAKSEMEVKAKVEKAKSKITMESSQNYVQEVKAALSSDSYRCFSETLLKYKNNRQIHDVVPVLADLFTGTPQNYHLFKKFFRFVREEDKQYYARTCFELTGLSCEHKSSGSGNEGQQQKKVPAKLQDSRSQGAAGATTSSTTSCDTVVRSNQGNACGSFGDSFSVNQPGTSGTGAVNSSNVPTEFRGYIPYYKDTVNITVVKMGENGRMRTQSKNIHNSSASMGHECVLWSSDEKTKEHFKHDDRKSYEELVKRGAIDPKDELFTPDMFVYPKTWEEAGIERREHSRFPKGHTIFSTCVLCNKEPVNGLQHECGAVCCFLCWKVKVFEGPEDRKCPYPHCGARVKRKHLKPVGHRDGQTS